MIRNAKDLIEKLNLYKPKNIKSYQLYFNL